MGLQTKKARRGKSSPLSRHPRGLALMRRKKANARTEVRAFAEKAMNALQYYLQSGTLFQYLINQTIFSGSYCRHEVVAIGILADLIDRTTGLFSQDSVQTFTQVQNFT